MQSKLGILRSQLNQLRHRRAAVRWTSAICAPTAVVLWLLVAAFLFDWSLNLSVLARGAILLLWVAAGVWAIKKLAWPLVKVRESADDMALMVERQHKIDSDLVAALQFEQPHASTWGSARLSNAVVDYVAEFSPSLNVFEGFSFEPLPRRAVTFAITLLLVMALVVAFPGHASAFWNRFLLGSAHYPTKTRIDSIAINGQAVSVFSTGTPSQVRIPYGQSVRFQVVCSGEVPATGVVELNSLTSDARNRIDLSAAPDASATFSGEASHIADSFQVRFQFGDAVSDPIEVTIVPLPLVDIAWEVTPPAYAASSLKANESDGGLRQLSVLEGSRAMLRLSSSNKPLKSASLTVNSSKVELVATDKLSSTWGLPAETPFDKIQEALKYEIQVVDQDGLSLETAMTGQIRLKADRLPRIVASAVTRQVLPTAQPKLDYAAGDDFGVARILAVVQISREDGRTSQHEVVAKQVPAAEQPTTIVRGQIAIPLSPYELAKGDEVKVTLEVIDWRGELVGQQGRGEPTSFLVTDLNGILAQTGEEDKKSAKQLDEILRRELGIGGEKK